MAVESWEIIRGDLARLTVGAATTGANLVNMVIASPHLRWEYNVLGAAFGAAVAGTAIFHIKTNLLHHHSAASPEAKHLSR
jgi:hypothetical protein